MSRALIEKLRRACEVKVTIDGKNYTVRRPTDAEIVELQRTGGATFAAVAKQFVVGWDLVELDLVPGGGPEPVPFDAELWAEWVADRLEMWAPIANAALDAYFKHRETRDADAKNS